VNEEASEAIAGDAIAAALERPGRKGRGFFRGRKRDEKKSRFTHCEDCGAELHGRYCSVCGQAAVDYHRSFRHVIADVAESFLNWDSKFLKTIGLLVVRPGWLTNQFVAGRRTRYLHPLRLYLLVSIVFFLCGRLVPIGRGPVKSEFTVKERDKVEAALKNIPTMPDDVREEVNRALAKAGRPVAPTLPISPSGPAVTRSPASSPRDEGVPLVQFDDSNNGPFGNWLEQRVKDKVGADGTRVQLFADALRSNISTMMLFCIPLFAFVLKILYLRQRRFYIEHLVYALHIHAFFYIAVLLTAFGAMAAKQIAPTLERPFIWLCVLAIVAQVFVSIRQVYRQSWVRTTFKFLFGGFVYFLVLVAAFVLTAFVTIALP
jgi:hypothetical protein